MAVPKRKLSKARTRKRRSAWKMPIPASAPCPQCGEPRVPHRVCGECGHYDGREVIKKS